MTDRSYCQDKQIKCWNKYYGMSILNYQTCTASFIGVSENSSGIYQPPLARDMPKTLESKRLFFEAKRPLNSGIGSAPSLPVALNKSSILNDLPTALGALSAI